LNPELPFVSCGVPRRLFTLFLIALAALILSQDTLSSQMTEEEKRRLFLKVRGDMKPVPQPTASPKPKPKPAPTPEKKRWTPAPSPTPRPKATPAPAKPARQPAPIDDSDDYILIPSDTPQPRQTPPPARSTPAPTQRKSAQQPTKKPPTNTTSAPIRIEKSGLQEEQGYEPPKKGFGSGPFKRWRYLTPAVRKAIDNAKVQRGRWKYIVIHNSATRQGNARIFDNYHRRVRKMQNGLAYHFVIGNGNSSGDGQIEIGERWTRQINGGHVASNYLNNIAIGICLVGDLNRDQPTAAQMQALDELVTYLRQRVGKVKGRSAIVKGHKEINPKPTDCPGRRFPLSFLRKRFGG